MVSFPVLTAEPVDDTTARWAVANCPLLRQRFGVADLATLLGAWEEADVDEVLAAPSSKCGSPEGRGGAWTEEPETSDKGRRRL